MDDKLERELAKYKWDTTTPAREVMEHLYKAILAIPEFKLQDGITARLDPYVAPEVDDQGELKCGFDVLLDNGTHLEFMVRNTGWGKSFVADQQSREDEKRQR